MEKKRKFYYISFLILLIALFDFPEIVHAQTTSLSKTETLGLFGGISFSLGPGLFEEGSEEQAAVSLVRKAIDSKEIFFWSSWLSKEFFKIAVKICIGLTNDPFLNSLMKLIDSARTTYEVENLFEDWLGRKNIKLSKGTLTLVGYENKKVNIQYIIIYYPENKERGKVVSEFYSSEIIECPKDPRGYGYSFAIWQWNGKISPFKLTVNGEATRTGYLAWQSYSFKIIGKPQINFIKNDIISGRQQPPQPTVTNQPPNPPTNLSQMNASGAGIGVGSPSNENTVVFKGMVSDPNNDSVKLQIELRRLNEYGGQFTGDATQESSLVSSGGTATITVSNLINANYHWRARAIDSKGAMSQWVSFGGNPDSATDFVVSVGVQPPTTQLSSAVIDAYNRAGGTLTFGESLPQNYTTPSGAASTGTSYKAVELSRGGIYEYSRGIFVVYGAIYQKYRSIGGARHYLGLPTSNEGGAARSPMGTTGRISRFERGSINWLKEKNQTFLVQGAIFEKWASLGYSGGQLGFPVSDEYSYQGGARSDFEGGHITWTSQTGAQVVYKTAPVVGPQIATISPPQVQAGQFTLTINGSNFDSGAIDQIYNPSGQLIGSGAQSGGLVSRSSNQIVVRENITGASAGTYTVKVKNSDGKLSNPINIVVTSIASPIPISIPILRWPLIGKQSDRRVLLEFGKDWTWDYCGNLPKRHTGVDLVASVGEEVFASQSGVVEAVFKASSTQSWGEGVTIQHNGFTTLYLHINPVVMRGQQVAKGQKIATIANIKDPHLHYGIRVGPYSNISNRGALPQKNTNENTSCQNDPLFPGNFINPFLLQFETGISQPPSDARPPNVTSFSASSSQINQGQSVTLSYSVSDDVGLSYVRLMRADDSAKIDFREIRKVSISGTQYSGSISDTPPSAGTYRYGLHVVDTANKWNCERNSQTNYLPGQYGPKQVVVGAAVTPPVSTLKCVTPPKGGPTDEWCFSTYGQGYCTDYVKNMAQQKKGVKISGWGHAKDWLKNSQITGYATGKIPEKNSIVVFNYPPLGHVSWVEDLSGETFKVSEWNYGKMKCPECTITENFGIKTERWINKSDSNISGFIYLTQQTPPTSQPIISKSISFGPYPSGQKYSLRVFNDLSRVQINGREVLSVGFYKENELDITGYLREGQNSIELSLENTGGGWTYGYTLKQGGNVIWNETCGSVGREGCRNNDQTRGMVARHSINLSISAPTVTPPSVSPTISMSPLSGSVGTTFSESGSGFTPNNTATLYGRRPDGSVWQITTVSLNSKGGFSRTWTAQTPGNNFAWWAVDNATGKKSNEIIYHVASAPPPPPPTCTDGAQFVDDVTVRDNTTMQPNQTFTKTWRLKNTGSCSWGSGYSLVFVGGSQMGAPSSVSVPSISQNATGDISVPMVAPSSSGSYQGNWQMKNQKGQNFGPQILVKINVTLTTTGCVVTVSSDRWKGEYFNNKSLGGSPLMVRDDGTGFLPFDWGTSSPSTTCGVPSDNFSVRWTRAFYFEGGTYRFSVTADDGVRFYVDGSLKLDKWFDQPAATHTVDVPLSAGNHTLRMEYYESGGQAVAKLSWQKTTTVPPPVTPTISVAPPSGPVGTTFSQTGRGFSPNRTATIFGRNPDGSVARIITVNTDSTGSFTSTWTAQTPGNNLARWAVDDATGQKSNEIVFNVTAPPISDTRPPNVTSFSASSSQITQGQSVTLSFSVTDDVGLSRVELWRADDSAGVGFREIKRMTVSGKQYSGSISDTPPSAGTYRYGVHVVDTSGKWNCERNSQTNNSPGQYGPKQVVVVGAPTVDKPPNVTSFSASSSQINQGQSVTLSYSVVDDVGVLITTLF